MWKPCLLTFHGAVILDESDPIVAYSRSLGSPGNRTWPPLSRSRWSAMPSPTTTSGSPTKFWIAAYLASRYASNPPIAAGRCDLGSGTRRRRKPNSAAGIYVGVSSRAANKSAISTSAITLSTARRWAMQVRDMCREEKSRRERSPT